MASSYAVRWREADGETYLGRLEVAARAMVLEGRGGVGTVRRTIGVDELTGFHIGRRETERLNGLPALVVERPGGDLLIASTVQQAGVLQELVHRLSQLR